MNKVDKGVFLGMLVPTMTEEEEKYIAYVIKSDENMHLSAQNVFDYLHLDNNDQLDEYGYNFCGSNNRIYENDVTFMDKEIDINENYKIMPKMKLASANTITEEELIDLLVDIALPMNDQFKLLNGHAYTKKTNK